MNNAAGNTIEAVYPLSPTQEGMLFHSLMEQGTGVYVVQVAFTLRGPVNDTAFDAAWRSLVGRHDVLRTAFVWEKVDFPVQVVGKEAALVLTNLDWEDAYVAAGSPMESKNIPGYLEWLNEDRARGFAAKVAPLMRVTKIRLGPEHFRVVWTYHHLILDGWSLPLLLKEWVSAYAKPKTAGEEVPSRLNYRDYIAWMQSQDSETAKSYWKRYLTGWKAPTSLGNLRQNVASETKSASLSISLAPACTQQLKSVAQRERVTMNTLVQGAWAILLTRISDQDDVVFGLARAGRPPSLSDVENRVGMFINTLPIRFQINDSNHVFGGLREIQRHQQEQQPFEYIALTEVHNASEIPRHVPLFETVVVFENYPLGSRDGQGVAPISIEEVTVEEQTNYSLSLFAVAGDALELRLRYGKSRFHERDIITLLDFLESILTGFLKSTNLPAADLFPRQPKIAKHASEVLDLSSMPPVHKAIAHRSEKCPNKQAVIFGDASISYENLDAKAVQFAAFLSRQGAKPGETVGILLHRSIDMVVVILGVLKVGCHYVPLDPTHPPARISLIVQDAELAFLVTQEGTLSPIHSGATKVLSIEEWKAEPVSSRLPDQAESGDLAYLIYTSGTTGKPKGVPITHVSLTNLLHSVAQRIGFTADQRLLAVTTLAFDIAALELLMPLVVGGTVVIADEVMARDGQQLAELITRYEIDTMQATPATWEMLVPHWKLSCWNEQSFTILCGGEAVEANLAYRLLETGATVWNVYGPTETTIWSGALKLSKSLISNHAVPIGDPLANTYFHVLDSRLRPVPRGVSGQLGISGAGLSPGYHRQEALTRERFVSLQGGDHETIRVYCTGDRVRADDDGTFEFLGRLDNQVKLRGYRLELGEIESALQCHEAVEQAVVVLQNEGTSGACLLAAMRLSPQASATRAELQSFLAERLPAYMVPTNYQEMPQLPLTPNGKIDRRSLSLVKVTNRASSGEPPKTKTEQVLAEIWCELLQMEQVSIHDNFFEMGGHSLLVLKAQNEIRERLEIELPLAEFFRHPTLHSLATYISSRDADGAAADRSEALDAGKARILQRRKRKHEISRS